MRRLLSSLRIRNASSLPTRDHLLDISLAIERFGLDREVSLAFADTTRTTNHFHAYRMRVFVAIAFDSLEPEAFVELFLPYSMTAPIVFLERMTNLRHLDLSHSFVRNLSEFTPAPSIRQLDISLSELNDIANIALFFPNLTELDLSDTFVSDLRPLQRLTQLHTLSLSGCSVENLFDMCITLLPIQSLRALALVKRDFSDDIAPSVDFLAVTNDGDDVTARYSPARLHEKMRGRRNLPSRVSFNAHYRSYIAHRLPHLTHIDGTPVEPELAQTSRAHFETAPHMHILTKRTPFNAFTQLQRREACGGVRRGLVAKHLESACTVHPHRIARVALEPFVSPRQVEYAPHSADVMAIGTFDGRIGLVHPQEEFHGNSSSRSQFIPHQQNGSLAPILGVAWLPCHSGMLLVGANDGNISLHNWERQGECVLEFANHPHLTSLCVDAEGARFAASGFSTSIQLYSLHTGELLNTFEDVHDHHINVSRFSSVAPHRLLTSSFDSTIKLWDTRQPLTHPTHTFTLAGPVITACWRPDDVCVLASAVDNEVKQFDLRQASNRAFSFTMRELQTGIERNYTRSYYSCDGQYVISGSSLESCVRFYNATTGVLFREVSLRKVDGAEGHSSVISLRGDPFRPFRMSAVCFADASTSTRMIMVDLLSSVASEG